MNKIQNRKYETKEDTNYRKMLWKAFSLYELTYINKDKSNMLSLNAFEETTLNKYIK